MSTPVFPAINPSYPVNLPREAQVNAMQFGDGYEQRSGAGINSVRKNPEIRWEVLTEAEADAIDDFLTDRKGVQAFMFTIPGDDSPTKYTCRTWDVVRVGLNNFAVTAQFKRDYNP